MDHSRWSRRLGPWRQLESRHDRFDSRLLLEEWNALQRQNVADGALPHHDRTERRCLAELLTDVRGSNLSPGAMDRDLPLQERGGQFQMEPYAVLRQVKNRGQAVTSPFWRKKGIQPTDPDFFTLTLILLFVASGCAALIYEIVWFQLLELVIGS